jgi:hypothetical protein
MTSQPDEPSHTSGTAETPVSAQVASLLRDRLRRSAQGQLFELGLRSGSGAPSPLSWIGGSSLYAASPGNWSQAFRHIGTLTGLNEKGLELPKTHSGEPLNWFRTHKCLFLWKKAVDPCHWQNLDEMVQRLQELRPVAARYDAGMRAIVQSLRAARAVEQWRAPSIEREALVRTAFASLLDWATAGMHFDCGTVAILLTGSVGRGFGLVSDVDYVPLVEKTSSAGETCLRESLERFATGMNACGIRADNVVAATSDQRRLWLTRDNWREEWRDDAVSKMRLASALLAVNDTPGAGDRTLAEGLAQSVGRLVARVATSGANAGPIYRPGPMPRSHEPFIASVGNSLGNVEVFRWCVPGPSGRARRDNVAACAVGLAA